MAKIMVWTDQQQIEWNKWVESRPPIIQDLCRRFPPYNLYKLESTGQRVTIYSYSEDGTLTVNITGEYNIVMFDRQVFGIKAKDIEECELLKDTDATGTILTEQEHVENLLDALRPELLAERRAKGEPI